MTWKMGLLVLLCVAPVSSVAQQKAPSCALTMLASLPMRTIPDGRVTVPVEIEGHTYQLMPNTGGYGNTLIPRAVKLEGYRPRQAEQAQVVFGNGVLNTYVAVKELGLGRARGHDVAFYVDRSDFRFYDGMLAPQIIGAYDSDFDFGHDKFNLILPEHCPGQVVYWTKDQAALVPMTIDGNSHIRIPVTIDGKKVMALIDTGTTTSVISESAAARYLSIDRQSPGAKPLRSSGRVFSYPFQTMDLGGISINRPHVEIIPDGYMDDKELTLGMGVLRQLHLYVAYKERVLYLTPALAK